MSIRQLATLGRRAVLSHNVRIVEGHAALRNQRYFSQGGKVFNEEEKAQENIFIKQKEAEALAKKVSEKISEGMTPEAAKEAVHKTAKAVNPETSTSSNTLYLAAGAATAVLGVWYFMQQPTDKKPTK